MMAAAHRPPKNKFGTSEMCEESPSFLMYPPPPSKKAKLYHPHGLLPVDKNHDFHNEDASNDNSDNDDRLLMLSSPTAVVLAHAIATASAKSTTDTSCANTVVKLLPPSLRGTAEAVKALNSSSRSGHNVKSTVNRTQQRPPTPQLVAFPTEALYVLTCCVKTVSKKKVLLANAAIVNGRNNNETVASSSMISSIGDETSTSIHNNSSLRESLDFGGKSDIHPSNPSLDRMLNRQTPLHHQEEDRDVKVSSREMATTPSVFVMDEKHAQHYCQFSPPKMFAIRPKQRSDLVQSSSSSSFEDAGCNEDSCNAVSSSSIVSSPSPSSSMSNGMPTPIPPSPKKSAPLAESSSSTSSSLPFPVTPRVAEKIPSSGVATYAISPIENNDAAGMNNSSIAQMPPSPPLFSSPAPSQNPRSSSNINSTFGMSKIRAVSFSESYEAFSRLANKFWPGPMIIYAPARMIPTAVGNSGQNKESTMMPNEHNKPPRTSSSSSNEMSSASCTSLPSFTNLPSLELKGGGVVPVLPPSVLIAAQDLHQHQQGCDSNISNEQQFFVGMQCPSHPLARKILSEIYRPRVSSSSSSSSSMKHSISTESFASFSSLDTSSANNFQYSGKQQQQNVRRGIALVGSYIEPSLEESGDDTILANSAANVTKILSSSSNNDSLNRGTEQIYIVNGEDTSREKFSVPTCNLGRVPPTSLLVDGDNRTIYLLHRRQHGGDGRAHHHDQVNKESVYRALLQPPSVLKSATSTNVHLDSCSNNKVSSMKEIDRVITAVLSRWKVVERDVEGE